MNSQQLPEQPPDKTEISGLEAQIAYFNARISLVGNAPKTAYQLAQIKTYDTLGKLLSTALKNLKGPTGVNGPV